jgi:integrating conjugative element membrane protein (TIGR03747 family)
MMSVIIEWIGMTWFWEDEKHTHAHDMVVYEQRFIDHRMLNAKDKASLFIYEKTTKINDWIVRKSNSNKWLVQLNQSKHRSNTRQSLFKIYTQHRHYIDAIFPITQVFFIRVAIIIFSLPTFFIAGLVGFVDGLVERHLRRWGGGRESSNIYNIARRSVWPLFFTSCVIYISCPITIHPAFIVMPSAILYGLSVRVTFERLKKYF